jgi:hypothetical protein
MLQELPSAVQYNIHVSHQIAVCIQQEAYLLTPAVYPALKTALNEQEVLLKRIQGEQGDGDSKEVEITIRDVDEDKEVLFIPDSSPPLSAYVDSSDVESDTGSINLIQRNTNFVDFT